MALGRPFRIVVVWKHGDARTSAYNAFGKSEPLTPKLASKSYQMRTLNMRGGICWVDGSIARRYQAAPLWQAVQAQAMKTLEAPAIVRDRSANGHLQSARALPPFLDVAWAKNQPE
jgi:hypothetical protein